MGAVVVPFGGSYHCFAFMARASRGALYAFSLDTRAATGLHTPQSRPRGGASNEPLRARIRPGTLQKQEVAHKANARNTKEVAVAGFTPPSRSCFRLCSAPFQCLYSSGAPLEQQLRLEANMPTGELFCFQRELPSRECAGATLPTSPRSP
jgi:hypothetical protein